MKKLKLFILFCLLTPFLLQGQVVWPGDVNNNGVVNEVDFLLLSFGVGQTGPARKTVSTEFTAQNIVGSWPTSLEGGVNLAYADCNGDGIIDLADFAAVEQNFGLTHTDVMPQPDEVPAGIIGVSPQMTGERTFNNIPNNRFLEVTISLGDSIRTVENLMGVSFYLKDLDNVVDLERANFEFAGWLQAGEGEAAVIQQSIGASLQEGTVASGRSAVGDLLVAYARTNNSAVSGNGNIGTITLNPGFVIIEDVIDFRLGIDSIILIDQDQNLIPVLGSEINISLVQDSDSTVINQTVCAGESYLFADSTLMESGTYRDTMTNISGGDSLIVLNLNVLDTNITELSTLLCAGDTTRFQNAFLTESGIYRDTLQSVNGCDSVLVLDLEVLDANITELSALLCAGDTTRFQNALLTESGIYRDTLQSVSGCDSVLVLNLEVLQENITELSTQLCAGDTTRFQNALLTESGIYRDTLQSVNGCDSVLVLDLEVLDANITELSALLCAGDTTRFQNALLTERGIYRDTLQSVSGCDSVLVLDLEVLDTLRTSLFATICEGESERFNNFDLTETGSYEVVMTAQNGCDSTVVLNLEVLPNISTILNDTICENESRSFAGQTLSAAGIYYDTLMAHNGCDSVVALDLLVFNNDELNVERSICQGESYLFNGVSLTTAGTYRDTQTNASGCFQFVNLNLTVLDTSRTELQRTICEGESYAFNNQMLTTAGTYRDTLENANGCNQYVVLSLGVLPTKTTELQETICQGEQASFAGQALTTSGTYEQMLVGANGCDSLVIFNLTVRDTFQTILNRTICEGSSINFDNQEISMPGTYHQTLTAQTGCDSFLVLNLDVSDKYITELNESICSGGSYGFGSQSLLAAGTYRDTFLAQNGCDSIVILNLTTNPMPMGRLVKAICPGEELRFNGRSITEEGVYYDTLQTTAGCDSLVELNLLLLESAEYVMDSTVCEGDTVFFNGFMLVETNTYLFGLTSRNGCDSTVVFHLEVLPASYTAIDSTICEGDSLFFADQWLKQEGIFQHHLQKQNGCDSLIEMQVIYAPSTQCIVSTNEAYLKKAIKIFPNPVYHELSIQSEGIDMERLQIVSVTGKVMRQRIFSKGVLSWTIPVSDLPPGMYWVQIATPEGQRQEMVVKM